MYVKVKILNRKELSLYYYISKNDIENFNFNKENNTIISKIVKVPIRNKIEFGYIESIIEDSKIIKNIKIKNIDSIEIMPNDIFYTEFINKLAHYYAIDSNYFFKKICQFLNTKEKENSIILTDKLNYNINSIKLTKNQESISNKIKENLIKNKYYPILIHGITGSGKTEIYKKLIIETLNLKKSVILLIPEITLAIEFYNIFKKCPEIENNIYSFHSATSIKEKQALWQALIRGHNILIIGVQLPIFLPIKNLGLIIIDEEHDINFQSKKHPRINSKEAAIIRAKINNIPIILGSATPSITTLYNAYKNNWNIFELKERFNGKLPEIRLIKLNSDKNNKNRKNFWVTTELEEAIKDRLKKNEQIIIFINRRGYYFFIQCKDCGDIQKCMNCSVSLTVHKNDNNINLICHYCNYKKNIPDSCDSCKTKKSFLKKGIGTQQIVNILATLFPEAKIERADLDNTINRKNWQKIINDFNTGKIDILVGTQTITKGYNFEKVTLIGILWADINLGLPYYNCTEITLQQLIQVAGRAGRSADTKLSKSLVIIQTILNHNIYNYLDELNYKQFYEYEIKNRTLLKYPPYIRFAELEIKNKYQDIINIETNKIFENINHYIIKNNLDIIVLGPSIPPINVIKKIHIRKIYLKGHNINDLIKIFKNIELKKYKSDIFFTPNPLIF